MTRVDPGYPARPGTEASPTMETGMKTIRTIFKNDKGATAIEYGLIAALIAVAAIGAMGSLGKQLGTTFNSVGANLQTLK